MKIKLDLSDVRQLLNELDNYADEQISKGNYIKKKVEAKRKEIFKQIQGVNKNGR